MHTDKLRQAFNDICNGYSKGELRGKTVYVKHLCHFDQLDLEEVEREYYTLAKNRGLPTQEMRLKQIMRDGKWTEKDEKEISDLNLSINSLIDGKKQAQLPSITRRIDQQIAEEKARLEKKISERTELLALTCENYSQRRLNEYYIFKNLFSDSFFTKPFFTEDEFDDISDSEMAEIIRVYNSIVEPCEEANIKKLSIKDFFMSYYYVCNDDFSAFYGRPIIRLTLYQIKLANYAKYFRGIFENYDMRNIPKDILADPDKIADWVVAADRAKKEVEKHKDSAMGGQAGATAEDRKAAGIQQNGPDPLMKALAAKGGGSLSKEEIMKVLGRGQ